MVEKTYKAIEPIKIRYRGVYDMKGLLRFVYKWITGNHYIYHEKRYKDKVESPFGNEIEIETYGERKVSEYYKYKVEINYHQWESKDIVVKVGGKEVTMMQGRIEIQISGMVITDWQNKFEKDTFWEKAQNFMEKSVINREIELKHVDPLDKDLHNLAADIKRFLKIESV